MIVEKSLFFTLLSCYLVSLGDSQELLVKKKVVVDIDKSLSKYLAKFYKHRFVEGQNNALAPLLDLYVLVLLYKVSDASTKTDLHTLLSIPEDAEDGTMDKFEAKIRQYLESIDRKSAAFETKLFVDSTIKASAKELKDQKFFGISSTSFSRKEELLQNINNWMTTMGMSNNHHFVRSFNFDDETALLILQVMSYRWKLPLSTTAKTFLGEQVSHLEGTLQGNFVKIDKFGIQVLEHIPSDSGLKLWLILPNSMNAFINATVDDNTLNEIANNLAGKQQFVKVSIPQVQIEFNSEENAFLQNIFHVLASMFTSRSIKLDHDKEEKYSIKAFLMHCSFQFAGDNAAKVSKQATSTVNFDKPFSSMVLTKDTNIPLLMVNYFSVKDKMLAMEDEEKILAALLAKEELANRADL